MALDLGTDSEGWLTRLEAASFRGVAFFTRRSEKQVGRRLHVNEYPARERPYVEDMGRKAEVYRVDAFVVGADYDLDRDALLTALSAPGPGALVTERHGTQTVCIEGASVVEDGAEGRYARIRFTAIEYGVNLEPAASSATARAIDDAAEGAAVALLAEFLRKLEPAVGWVEDRIASRVVEAVDGFTEYGLKAIQTGPEGVALEVAARSLAEQAAGLDLASIGSGLIDLYQGFSRVSGTAASRLQLLDDLATVDDDLPHALLADYVDGGDPDAEPADVAQDRAYHEAVASLVRGAIQTARVLAGVDVELTSVEETRRLRDLLLGSDLATLGPGAVVVPPHGLDGEILYAGTHQQDDAYLGLRYLRASMIEDLETRGERLPDRAAYTPAVTTSALLLSQRLYGSGDRDLELIDAIRPRHPGFIPGGEELRVLRV